MTQGTAVLLLHGLCSTPDELLSLHPALRSAGCTVVAPRIAGYSFDPMAPVQRASPWHTWIAATEAEVDALRRTHARVALVGVSAGASLALGAAIHCGTRIDAMVLMSTTLRFDGWAIHAPSGCRRWRCTRRWGAGGATANARPTA